MKKKSRADGGSLQTVHDVENTRERAVDIRGESFYNEKKLLIELSIGEVRRMRTPLVSVVVPVYNGAASIEKCLRRIQHQTYQKLEVLVVDDGSTDDTVEICEKLVDDLKRLSE